MPNALAVLVLALLVVAVAVYDLVRGLYFYSMMVIGYLILSLAPKRKERSDGKAV